MRFPLFVSYKDHPIDWMKARKGTRELMISVLLAIPEHPYYIMSVSNISKNKQLAVRVIRQN